MSDNQLRRQLAATQAALAVTNSTVDYYEKRELESIKEHQAALDAAISAAIEKSDAEWVDRANGIVATATKPLVDAGNAMRRTMYSNDSEESKAWDAALAQVKDGK